METADGDLRRQGNKPQVFVRFHSKSQLLVHVDLTF
jgi:hypothetical protein